jgi:putative ABC transport system substrate-binding protein
VTAFGGTQNQLAESRLRRFNRRKFLLDAARFTSSVAGLGILSSACKLLPVQTPANLPHIGYLGLGPRQAYVDREDAFVEGLRDLGYVEGQTVSIDWRIGPTGQVGDAPWSKLAMELVELSVDIIVTDSTPAAVAAREATSTIPIVATSIAYPLESGLVASLARPGGNLTALAAQRAGENAKHVELLRAIVPSLTASVDFVDVTLPSWGASWDEFRAAAESAGVDAERVDLHSAAEVEAVFELPVVGTAQAVNIAAGSLLFGSRERVAQLALEHHLAAIGGNSYADKGLLMSYAANLPAVSRRAAVFVDKILKGTPVGDLPVEMPSVFGLAINLTTAQKLGLTIPADVAAQVTQWIE